MREIVRRLFGFRPDLRPNEFEVEVNPGEVRIRARCDSDPRSLAMLNAVVGAGAINLSAEARAALRNGPRVLN